jgi:hypothetical protein
MFGHQVTTTLDRKLLIKLLWDILKIYKMYSLEVETYYKKYKTGWITLMVLI